MTTPGMSAPDLAGLVGSRLCHDLISPLGAIGNGIELLQLAGIADSPELALVQESLANAQARIRFFRIAYGVASPTSWVGRSEIVSVLEDMSRGGRLRVDWQVSGDSPREDVRLMFLLLQCFESAMPYGGVVQMRHGDRSSEGLSDWSMTGDIPANGRGFRIEPHLWAMLTDMPDFGTVDIEESAPVTASQVQFALLAEGLAQKRYALCLSVAQERIEARLFTIRDAASRPRSPDI